MAGGQADSPAQRPCDVVRSSVGDRAVQVVMRVQHVGDLVDLLVR
jgi:hypothetical protein